MTDTDRPMTDGPLVHKLRAEDATSVTLVTVPPFGGAVFPEVWHVPTRVYNAVLAATPSPLDVMVAARDVDLSWFVAGLGDGTVKMRYASDLPRVLNALREALAANKDATPAPLDVQRLARALRKCSLIPSLYRGPVEAWFPTATAIAAAYAEETT